jgi:glutathione S-transferase
MNSVNVQKVAWCLDEIGAPFQRIEAGREYGVVGTAEYCAMNPNGLVPTIRDGALTLWESNAILRYLCARYSAGAFWANDPGERALADRWMDWQQTALSPAMGPAFMALVRTPPEQRDMAVVASSLAATEKQMALLDAALAGSPWLGGGAFGMADLAVAPHAHRWLNMPIKREGRAQIERWVAACLRRPMAGRTLTLPIT